MLLNSHYLNYLGLRLCNTLRIHSSRHSSRSSPRQTLIRPAASETGPSLEAAHCQRSAKPGPVLFSALVHSTTINGLILEQVVSSLRQLPELDACDEEGQEANGNSPLPGDALVLEELGVEGGYIDHGEDRKTANDYGPEQELVGIDILEEGELAIIIRVKTEHGSTKRLELPSRHQDHPGEFSKGCSTGFEDRIAAILEAFIAARAEVTPVGAVDNDDKGHKSARTHDRAIDQHVENDLVRKDTTGFVLRWLAHDI